MELQIFQTNAPSIENTSFVKEVAPMRQFLRLALLLTLSEEDCSCHNAQRKTSNNNADRSAELRYLERESHIDGLEGRIVAGCTVRLGL